MRIIHTADWHIGQTLRGYPREFEHQEVFKSLGGLLVERGADAMIVAGDIFDSQNPSGEAMKLLYDTLLGFKRLCPQLNIVIVAGNHDAASRLEAPRSLLRSLSIHVVGALKRRDANIDIDHHLIPLTDEKGEPFAMVLAVSHPTPACLPHFARLEDEPVSPIIRAVGSLYGELVEAARPRLKGLPLILTGHLHVAGGLESEGSERRILVGGQHAVPPDVFPSDAAYVALGHLHKHQHIGRQNIRYSGSLLPLSAAEQTYAHGVSVVTLDGKATSAEHVPIARPVPFLRLPERGEIKLSEVVDHLKALDLSADIPLHQRPFVHIALAREGLTSSFREEIDRMAAQFPVRLVDIRVAPLVATNVEPATASLTIRLAERDPEDLFRLAYERQFGKSPETDHLDVFHHALAQV